MFTLAIGPLLVGMSVDDGIHMMDRLRGGDSTLTILRESGSAMVITTFTTAAGFACLALSSVPGVRELGVIGASGILGALAASLHLLPVCHALLAERRHQEQH
jgi:predicted RND superfamily exporter protein